MKKSLGLLMIVIAVIAMAFVSCDASTAPKADAVGEVVLDSSQSRGISVTVNNTADVESLFWYYRAAKNDTGVFNTGATGGFVPVKSDATAGLSGANLGLFSYGNWTFTFYGVKEAIDGVNKNNPVTSIFDNLIVYSGHQTIEVNKDKNFLNLMLNEGAGLTTEIKFDNTDGVWFSHENITNGMSFSLTVVDKVNGVQQGEITAGAATFVPGSDTLDGIPRVKFKDISYTLLPSGGIAEGKHVMTFTLTQTVSGTTTNIANVATYEIAYTVSKGLTYTIKGDLTPTEVTGNVEVGSYAKSVPETTAKLVLPVESSESKKVTVPTEVSTLDLLVKYPIDTLLESETNTAGSGDNVTADATIGFELQTTNNPNISITTSQAQTTYELTLNVDQNNSTLVEVSKFIGKNLEIEAIYHSSILVKDSEHYVRGEEYYEYSPTDGILKLYVKHASLIDVVTKKTLAVASIGNVNYATVEAALEAALPGDTIRLGVGEYEPFCINKANITIKGIIGNTKEESTVIKSTDNFVSSSNGLTSGNLTIRATGVIIDSIWFDVKTKQNAGSWTTRGAFFASAEDATINGCIIEGSGNNDGSTAAFFYGKKITITGCYFKDFERGIYHMGDTMNDPQFTIKGNTFDNVLVPFDTYVSQPLSSDDANSYITITGNIIKGTGPSYIQIWDHSQWTNKNKNLGNYAGIKNVTLNNTGNIVYYLTHFNMLTENNEVNVYVGDNQKLLKRSYVEVDVYAGRSISAHAVPYGYVTKEDSSAITDWNVHTSIIKNNGKFYIYTIVPGTYKLFTTENGKEISNITINEQEVGTIQRVENQHVCHITTEEQLKTELSNVQSDNTIIVLQNDIVLTAPITISRSIAITSSESNCYKLTGYPVTASEGTIVFSNIIFDSPKNEGNNASNLYVYKNADVTIDGCEFINPQWDAIQVTSGVNKITVTNCKFNTSIMTENPKTQRYIHIQESKGSLVDGFYQYLNGEPVITITNNVFNNVSLLKQDFAEVDYIHPKNVIVGNNKVNDLGTNVGFNVYSFIPPAGYKANKYQDQFIGNRIVNLSL